MFRKSIFQLKKTLTYRFFGDISKIEMAALSPTMKTGQIIEWFVKEGDKIEEEQKIVLVKTDKAEVDLKSMTEGYIAKLLFKEGDEGINVGDVIAYVVEDLADVSKIPQSSSQNQKSESQTKADPPKDEHKTAQSTHSKVETKTKKPTPSHAEQKTTKPAKTYPTHKLIGMPSLSPTTKEPVASEDGKEMKQAGAGKVMEICVKVGDEIKEDDLIAKIETDKSTMDFRIKDEGFVAKIFADKIGEDLPLGAPFLLIVEDKESIAEFADYQPPSSQSHETHEETSTSEVTETKQETSSLQTDLFISPRAKKLINNSNLSEKLSEIKGTGPYGRIIEQNVQAFLSKPSQNVDSKKPQTQTKEVKKVVSDLFEEFEPTAIRKVIARRLTESKSTVPHYYLSSEAEMTNLLEFKERIFKETGKKLSVNDFLIKAIALACQDVPETNSQMVNNKIRQYKSSSISFAYNSPIGLITPIVQNADQKSLSQINQDFLSLIEKAKVGKLAPSDYEVC